MPLLVKLSFQSLWNRKATVLITIFTIAISVCLLMGVEKVRTQTKQHFTHTISGTDLILGARSGSTNLLLYSVFRIGNATNNISWQTFEELQQNKRIKWIIPISLGDSHKGYRVIGTDHRYFEYYNYGKKQPLTLQEGTVFSGLFDVVLGAEVAEKLGYKIGDSIILAHGLSDKAFSRHDNLPFKVVGILAKTSTPVDESVHVSLEAIEAIHIGWESGANLGHNPTPEEVLKIQHELKPEQITAAFVGLKSRIHAFALQRYINTYKEEPLSAIMPGIALQELWGVIGILEKSLLAISGFVVISGLLGMLASLITSLQERRREIAILRSVGAKPYHIFALLIGEATVITLVGMIVGVATLNTAIVLFQNIIQSGLGVVIYPELPSTNELMLLGIILASGIIISFIPAFLAYRHSLVDGITIKV